MEKLYGRWLPTCYGRCRIGSKASYLRSRHRYRLQNRLKELLVPQTGGDSPAYSSDGSHGQENMYDDDDNPILPLKNSVRERESEMLLGRVV
jgi:hypothetical protein